MSERDYSNWDDWINAGGWEGTGQGDPGQNPGQPAPGPPDNPLQPGLLAEKPPPPPPGAADNRPPKPDDPGDGRVWVWVGDRWALTVPDSNYAPHPLTPKGTGTFDYGRQPGMLDFSAYRPFDYPDFSYEPFKASDRTMLYDDSQNPGFTKSQERLQKMIEAGAAYKGVLRSGNTFDELGSILGNNEEAQFKAFDDRRFRDWMGNRTNAFGAWQANEGEAERDNQRFNDYRFNTEKASFDDMLSRWQTLVNSTTQLALPRD